MLGGSNSTQAAARRHCSHACLHNHFMELSVSFCLLQEALPDDWQLSPQNFKWVLNIALLEGHYRWCFMEGRHLIRNAHLQPSFHTDAGGIIAVSQAVNKLKEALLLSGIDLSSLGIALDLGELC